MEELKRLNSEEIKRAKMVTDSISFRVINGKVKRCKKCGILRNADLRRCPFCYINDERKELPPDR